MSSINSVIIDDESFNRELVKDFILKLNPAYNIIGEADNIEDGYELINRFKPDLVFLDIKMPGGSGFDLLERFKTYNFEVVFITGFDEYAIKAFEFNALDYVLKPIDQSKFRKTLDNVKARFDNRLSNIANLTSVMKSYEKGSTYITKIPVHYHDEVILLGIEQLMYVQSEEGYTTFFTIGSEKYVSSRKLSDFEFIINNFPGFIRINKGVYVNLHYIKAYSKGETCVIKLFNDVSFEVSRRKKTEILAILDRK